MARNFKGKNYKIGMTMKEVAKAIRQELKKELPEFKFSVRQSISGGGTGSVDVVVVKGEQLMSVEKDYIQVGEFGINENERLNNYGKKVMQTVADICNSYNFDYSDIMTDYFHVNFYLHMYAGSWDRPYIVIERKEK